MKNIRNILVGAASAILLSAISTGASAQSANADAAIKAKIIAPASIAKVTDLDFGTVVSSATGGTVTVTGSGTGERTVSSGLAMATSTYQPATFTVTGTVSTPFGITETISGLPTGFTLATATSGCNQATTVYSIGTGTTCLLTVGGTLTVPAGAAAQTVGGTLNIAVLYN